VLRLLADSLDIDVEAVGPGGIGGARIEPGDLLLGDHGVVAAVPAALAEEAIGLAEEKVAGENLVREKLAEGMPVSEAFRTYGVL
jgi:4-hydroxy-4-methyl-2-oxoglutarate aldolase